MPSVYPDTLQAHLKPTHTLGTKAAGCMLVNTWQQWRPVAPLTALLKGAVSYSTHSASASAKKPPISQRVRFIDWLRVVARGGQGGGGSSALFGRTGHHPRAAGGNGAPGGSVVLRATRQLTGLGSIPLHVEAERGGHGGKQWMDGKKGPDRVVQVPLGTMVWRMVQLKGSDTPHGVTALTQPPPAAAAAAATAAPQSPLHQGQVQQPWRHPPGAHGAAGLDQQEADGSDSSSSSSSSSSSGGQHSRRKLFSDNQVEHDADTLAAAGADHEAAGSTATAASKGSASVMHRSSEGQQQEDEAAGTIDRTREQRGMDSLYDDLVQCRVVLSNQEKLQLLHTGCLGGSVPSVAASMLDWEDSNEQDESSSSDYSSDSDSDVEESDQEEDEWGGQQQGGVADSHMLLGEDGGAEARHFDKQQVWSILSAQAELLGVLESEGQELLVARGGRGGRGNALAPSNHQRPASKQRSDGKPGEEVLLLLQLRLMADVALVGLPNVGKSSLIAALTGARAQVGSYAFTTLRPQLGVLLPTVPDAPTAVDGSTQQQQQQQQQQQDVQQLQAQPQLQPASDKGSHHTVPASSAGSSEPHSVLAAAAAAGDDQERGLTGHQLVLADLPGLVPGAHEGRGRGTDFLQHLQKVRCIVLVVDMTGRPPEDCSSSSSGVDGGQEGEGGWQALVPHSPEQQVQILLDELRCYDAKMLSLPMLVVANKVDAMSVEGAAAALQKLKAATELPIVPVSAQQHLGLLRLRQSLQTIAGGVHTTSHTG